MITLRINGVQALSGTEHSQIRDDSVSTYSNQLGRVNLKLIVTSRNKLKNFCRVLTITFMPEHTVFGHLSLRMQNSLLSGTCV
jgi:hypothetical protein